MDPVAGDVQCHQQLEHKQEGGVQIAQHQNQASCGTPRNVQKCTADIKYQNHMVQKCRANIKSHKITQYF